MGMGHRVTLFTLRQAKTEPLWVNLIDPPNFESALIVGSLFSISVMGTYISNLIVGSQFSSLYIKTPVMGTQFSN